MFVVLGASGNTGRVVAETLLAQERQVRVVVHDANKGASWQARGAEVATADLEDRAALERAFSGAQGAYVLLPPMFGSTQVRADNARRAGILSSAIDAAKVAHVVLLSSVGAQQPEGTGPILSLHDAEATFLKTRATTSFLRAAYFMENWATSLFALAQGVLPTFLLADHAIPMVATRDIGLAAAKLLVESSNEQRVIELSGPRDYAPNDVAAALGRIIGKSVVAQQQPVEAMASALMGAGLNAEWGRLFQELTQGLNVGHVKWEGGHPLWRGETDIEAVLAPLAGGK